MTSASHWSRRNWLLAAALATASALLIAVLWVAWRFDGDMQAASAKAAHGSTLVNTPCGAIEYQEAGTGTPLLMVHGSGGGHDQGMAFARKLTQRGIRVIAMSRFGYLRTPMPADSSPAAQAAAHVCLLDTLGILHAARDQVIQYVLATPPELVSEASPQERARVDAILERILPVSSRAAGLRSDSVLGKSLGASALNKVRVPTLVASLRDDGFGTYASAQYTASQIQGAEFVGFEHGAHVWVGHDDEVMVAVSNFLMRVQQ